MYVLSLYQFRAARILEVENMHLFFFLCASHYSVLRAEKYLGRCLPVAYYPLSNGIYGDP